MRLGAILLLLGILAGALRAQTPGEYLDKGIAAYQALDYDQAQVLLRRSITKDSSSGPLLSRNDRARALSFLGATELFRGRRDSAAAAFRALVLLDPNFHPDDLVFPPKVTSLYQEVRRGTKALAVEAAPVSETHGRLHPFAARVVTSSLSDVTITVERQDGTRIRTLYTGPVVDSMTVLWDGLTADGSAPSDGRYALRVTPRSGGGTPGGLRAITLPLEIRQIPLDTLAWPNRPELLPEHTTAQPAFRALGAGVLAGTAALVLPSIVSRGVTASSARLALGVGLTTAGIVGFVTHRPGRPIPDNVAANQENRRAWQQEVAGIRNENAQRRAGTRLEIHAGPTGVALLEDTP